MTARELPMFPLRFALVPGAEIPLHVFEPRYRALVHDVLAGDAEFGVVLIEEGSDVGGGETRSNIGTIARIVDGHAYEDGRYNLACLGIERISVDAWLPDDPYPRAMVEEWPDPHSGPCTELRASVVERLHDLSMCRMRLKLPNPVVKIAHDPTVASYEAALLADLGSLGLQELLTCPDAATRLELVLQKISDEITLLDLEAYGM